MTRAITAVTGLTPDEFNYITKGQPALTRMPYGQQRKVKAAVEQFLNKNGVDLSTFQSQYNAQNTTLSSNITRFNNTQIAEGEVLGTMKNLNATAITAGLTGVNLANVGAILTGQNINDPTANAYAFYFNDLQNSLSYYYAAQQGKSSPDIIDQEDAARVIVGGLSTGGLKGLQDATIQTTLKMKGVLAGSVDRSQQAVWDLFGVGSQYTPLGIKGQMSDSTYVAQALQDNQIENYNSLISKIPAGKIAVVDNTTEEIFAIDPGQFNSSKYTRL